LAHLKYLPLTGGREGVKCENRGRRPRLSFERRRREITLRPQL
jgi:hypothetical protein